MVLDLAAVDLPKAVLVTNATLELPPDAASEMEQILNNWDQSRLTRVMKSGEITEAGKRMKKV